MNPVSLTEPGWKEVGILNQDNVISFLKDYKWSSYKDYIGENNFPSVTERTFLSEFLGGINGCNLSLKNWIANKRTPNTGQEIFLE